MSVGSFVSARDYRDYGGWGTSSPDELAELRKALTAGSDVNDPGVAPGVGFPLRTESLEAQLKNLTFEMSEIKLFRSIAKVPASNTVEEFNRLVSYSRSGSRRFNMGWMSEGALPEEEDSTYERVTVLTKYLGVVGRVTHVANTIRAAHGNVIALETMNKTMDLLKNLENALFFGNSALIPEQVDGLEKLITDAAPDNVVDLRGAALTEGAMNDMLLQIRQNYGMATDAYFSAGAFSDLAKQVYERQRFALAPAPGTLGTTVTAFQGQHGKINLHDHVFFEDEQSSLAAGLGDSSKAPITPSITVAPAAAVSGNSQFVPADDGTYIYQVVAGNKYGLSAPVDTAGVALVGGESVTFTVADGGQGTTFYEIYRSDVDAAVSTAKLMTRVARTGATQVITDNNDDIPGTTKGFVLQQNQRSMSWAQLLPMTRVPLATIDTSIRWAQVVYGAIKLYTPARNIVVKNIGREPGSL